MASNYVHTNNCRADLYWNQEYAKGFSGNWVLKGDSLGLNAVTCYKGKSGAKLPNNCDEDFKAKSISMIWDGKNIKFGPDTNQIILTKE